MTEARGKGLGWLRLRRQIEMTLFILKLVIKLLILSLFHRPVDPRHYAPQIRQFFEKMGLAYVKFGQFLALRFDILPMALCEELSRLFENAHEIPFEEIRAIVEAELGASLEELFATFDPNPIAAASVAQVHEGTLPNGDRVAIKVQRPGIASLFEADIMNLATSARVMDRLHMAGYVSVMDVIDQFSLWTRRELDFRTEARTADRLRAIATANEIVPRIYEEYMSPRVLVLEFIDGVSLRRVIQLKEAGKLDEVKEILPGFDIGATFKNVAEACLHQLFEAGFFHGDPHPGNIIVLPDNKVAFIDFGIFGQMSVFQRKVLRGHIENIALGNVALSYRYYIQLYGATPHTDLRGFSQEAMEILQLWYDSSIDPHAPIKDKHLGKYWGLIIEALRRHRMVMSMDTLLFWRTMLLLDANALYFSEDIDLLEEMRAFFLQLQPEPTRYVLDTLLNPATTMKGAEVFGDLPGLVTQTLSQHHGRGWPTRALVRPRDERAAHQSVKLAALAFLVAAAVFLVSSLN